MYKKGQVFYLLDGTFYDNYEDVEEDIDLHYNKKYKRTIYELQITAIYKDILPGP